MRTCQAPPTLSIHASWAAFLAGDTARSESHLAHAEAAIGDDPAILGRAKVLRAHHHRMRGQIEEGIRRAQEALASPCFDRPTSVIVTQGDALQRRERSDVICPYV